MVYTINLLIFMVNLGMVDPIALRNIPVECLRSATMPDTHDLGPLDHPNRRCFKLFPHDVP
jgi:hypothetical protein